MSIIPLQLHIQLLMQSMPKSRTLSQQMQMQIFNHAFRKAVVYYGAGFEGIQSVINLIQSFVEEIRVICLFKSEVYQGRFIVKGVPGRLDLHFF